MTARGAAIWSNVLGLIALFSFIYGLATDSIWPTPFLLGGLIGSEFLWEKRCKLRGEDQ